MTKKRKASKKQSVRNAPPIWCKDAVPSKAGWRDPKTNELLISIRGLKVKASKSKPKAKDPKPTTKAPSKSKPKDKAPKSTTSKPKDSKSTNSKPSR